jgi:hypothetical protein
MGDLQLCRVAGQRWEAIEKPYFCLKAVLGPRRPCNTAIYSDLRPLGRAIRPGAEGMARVESDQPLVRVWSEKSGITGLGSGDCRSLHLYSIFQFLSASLPYLDLFV